MPVFGAVAAVCLVASGGAKRSRSQLEEGLGPFRV